MPKAKNPRANKRPTLSWQGPVLTVISRAPLTLSAAVLKAKDKWHLYNR